MIHLPEKFPCKIHLKISHPRWHCVSPLKYKDTTPPCAPIYKIETDLWFDNEIEYVIFHLLPRIDGENVPIPLITFWLNERRYDVKPNFESLIQLKEQYHEKIMSDV